MSAGVSPVLKQVVRMTLLTLFPATRSAAWRAFDCRPVNVRVTGASGVSAVMVPIMSTALEVLP